MRLLHGRRDVRAETAKRGEDRKGVKFVVVSSLI